MVHLYTRLRDMSQKTRMVYVDKDPKSIEEVLKKKWVESKNHKDEDLNHILQVLTGTYDEPYSEECLHKVIVAKERDCEEMKDCSSLGVIVLTDCPGHPIVGSAVVSSMFDTRIYRFDEK